MIPRTPPAWAAFSLLELLVVMAIVTLLSLAALPAFHAIASAHGVTKGAYDLAELVELARSEAVARQTYVWVGVATNNSSGNAEVIAASVYSRDGSGTNTNTVNLAALSKVIHLRNAALASWSDLKAGTKAQFTNQVPASIATNTGGISFNVGGAVFQSRTITFTPRGEATLSGSVGPDDGFDPGIDIGFRQARGATVLPGADDAAVVIDGATGMARIIRLP